MHSATSLRMTMETSAALLAVRFWDQALEVPVTHGLIVTAAPATGPPPAARAVRAGDCWHIFRRLPGLTHRTGASTGGLPYTVVVRDEMQRFQPIAFQVDLPLQGDGTFTCPEHARRTPDDRNWITLCSSRGRRSQPQLAMITGQLVGPDRTPAPHAVLEVQTPSGRWYSIADAQGCLALLFPYPPLLPGRQPEWQVTLTVRYGGLTEPPVTAGLVDPLKALRQTQTLIYTGGGAPVKSFPVTIRYGEVCVLTGDTPSALRVGGSI